MWFLLDASSTGPTGSVPGSPSFARLNAAARAQARRTAESSDATAYPAATHNDTPPGNLNTWKTSNAGGWTSGFFPGILWKLAAADGMSHASSAWVTQALRWTEGMRAQQYDTQHHDVGFKVFGSFGQALELASGSSVASKLAQLKYADVVNTAARSLSTRFDPAVGCTQSWNAGNHCKAHPNVVTDFPVIIDNMMNLELLFWAARNSSNDTLHQMAESHANKTALNHVRPEYAARASTATMVPSLCP
jgi:unsaturated chondroitin disaccharide hydrolase